jgi:hypothetical protein
MCTPLQDFRVQRTPSSWMSCGVKTEKEIVRGIRGTIRFCPYVGLLYASTSVDDDDDAD